MSKPLINSLLTSAALLLLIFLPLSTFAGDKTEITWIGQSGFRIITPAGRVLFIDPWFTNSALANAKE